MDLTCLSKYRVSLHEHVNLFRWGFLLEKHLIIKLLLSFTSQQVKGDTKLWSDAAVTDRSVLSLGGGFAFLLFLGDCWLSPHKGGSVLTFGSVGHQTKGQGWCSSWATLQFLQALAGQLLGRDQDLAGRCETGKKEVKQLLKAICTSLAQIQERLFQAWEVSVTFQWLIFISLLKIRFS